MLHPDTELRDAGKETGLGVFATRRLPRGTLVWVRDELDRSLPLEQVRALPVAYRRLLDRYGFLDRDGNRILCWDAGRFVNHDCDANVLPTPWSIEIAVRTIHAGEQLTNDYATLNLERGFRCACGDAACRGWVRPRDFEKLVSGWDERVRAALPYAAQLEQPLLQWLDPARRRAIRAGIRDPARMPSIRANRLEAARIDPMAFAANPTRRRPSRHPTRTRPAA